MRSQENMHLPQRPTILQKNDTGEPQDTEFKTAIINIIQQFRQLTEDRGHEETPE